MSQQCSQCQRLYDTISRLANEVIKACDDKSFWRIDDLLRLLKARKSELSQHLFNHTHDSTREHDMGTGRDRR